MKADLAMAIHFHQPVGNFDHVMERACDKCYIPFLETLKKYPGIRMTFHFTGCLLEWAEAKRPELIEDVSGMVRAGQVEVMSGGFYEPILASIPPEDRLSQIRMLNRYVKEKFSFEPKGAWVAERVWEPSLASDLSAAGIKYVILDDTHFLYSGVTKDKTYGYYVTEDNGGTVAVFPSDKVLRYHIPFKMPEECTGYMKSVLESRQDPLFIYGDDGEKFGEWPGTHKWVFEEKWLEKFFDEITGSSDWLKTVTLSECLEKRKPLGRVYLPTTSYEEMLEWALPAGMQRRLEDVIEEIRGMGKEEYYKPFIRGGFWRNFFAKYPESNHMNKKMLYVSRKLGALRDAGAKKDPEEAEKDLFRGQCNCAYWHGVFGGLYLYHLRRAVYHHLIKSEAAMDAEKYGKKHFCGTDVLDLDADGLDEVVLENRSVAMYFDPAEGGVMKELDSKVICQNLLNSLARREEAYHRKILEKLARQEEEEGGEVKTIHEGIQEVDAGVEDNLTYDRYGRHSLVDHFLGEDVDIDALSRCEYNEEGDFAPGEYAFEVKKSRGKAVLAMTREGNVRGERVSVAKEITLPERGSAFTVLYEVRNRSEDELNLRFAPEFNVTMPDSDSERYSLIPGPGNKKGAGLGEKKEYPATGRIEIRDAEKSVSFRMELSEKCSFWHFPVKTVSQSEKAYELNYQSSALVPVIDMRLAPGRSRTVRIKVDLVHGVR